MQQEFTASDKLITSAVYKANLIIEDHWFLEITHYFDHTMTELGMISHFTPENKVTIFPEGRKWHIDILGKYRVVPI